MKARRRPPAAAANLRAYLVGGAVRDALLGREAGDRDFVVIGATPEQMLAAGYKPAGADFPVFIHPQTGEEYALARTERKSGRGHRGFTFYAAPEVSLPDDLRRRDLTINAMARGEDGDLIDPFGGAADIAAKKLRHVSPAFAEDPLRVLRVARFAAALPDFSIAEETRELMRELAQSGETAELSAERVWRELARGFAAPAPRRMIEILEDCGALAHILPEIAALRGVPERLDYHPEGDTFIHTMMALDAAADLRLSAEEVFAVLLHDTGKAETPAPILPSHHGHEARSAELARRLCARLKTPRRFAELAVLSAAEHGNAHNALAARASTVVDLSARLDAFRRPSRAESFLRVCEADYAYWPARRGTEYPQGAFLREVWSALAKIDGGEIARAAEEKRGKKEAEYIADQIRQARIKTARETRKNPKHEAAHQKMKTAKPEGKAD